MSMTCKSEPSLGDLGADFGKFTVQAVVADMVSILVDVPIVPESATSQPTSPSRACSEDARLFFRGCTPRSAVFSYNSITEVACSPTWGRMWLVTTHRRSECTELNLQHPRLSRSRVKPLGPHHQCVMVVYYYLSLTTQYCYLTNNSTIFLNLHVSVFGNEPSVLYHFTLDRLDFS